MPKKKTTRKKTATAKKAKTSTAVAKRASTEVGAVRYNPKLKKKVRAVDAEDFLIPKIWLMQHMSDLVQDGNAKPGEYRNSIDAEVIAGVDEEFEIIVFETYKVWQEFEVDKKGNQEFIGIKNFDEYPDLEIDEDLKGGKTLHRDKVLGFYCILPEDVEAGEAFPYIIDFKRTSRKAGQKLSTLLMKLDSKELPYYARTFVVSSYEDTNENKKKYCVKDIKLGREVNQAEVDFTEGWVETIQKAQERGAVKVDTSDVSKGAEEVDEDKSTREF